MNEYENYSMGNQEKKKNHKKLFLACTNICSIIIICRSVTPQKIMNTVTPLF
jgi:hypothetical protein